MQNRLSFISRGSLCSSAACVKLATLVCWFRGSFRHCCSSKRSLFFQTGGWWWCLSLRASLLLWQIPFEGDRLILCLKARFCVSEWPVCVVSLAVLERLHFWWAYLSISVSYTVPNDQTVSVSPVDIQAQGIDLLFVLFTLEMFTIAGFKLTDFWIYPHPQLDLIWHSEIVWRSFGLNTDQSWAPMGVLMCAVEAGEILCRETN